MLTQSYAHGVSPVPLIGDTLGVHFDRAVERWGNCDALIVRHQDLRWTWRELGERVDAIAAGLLALGLEPGDRVGIWSPNNAEWVVTQFATAKRRPHPRQHQSGVSPRSRSSTRSTRSACKALVTAPSFKTSDYLGMLRTLAPGDRRRPAGQPRRRAAAVSAAR